MLRTGTEISGLYKFNMHQNFHALNFDAKKNLNSELRIQNPESIYYKSQSPNYKTQNHGQMFRP